MEKCPTKNYCDKSNTSQTVIGAILFLFPNNDLLSLYLIIIILAHLIVLWRVHYRITVQRQSSTLFHSFSPESVIFIYLCHFVTLHNILSINNNYIHTNYISWPTLQHWWINHENVVGALCATSVCWGSFHKRYSSISHWRNIRSKSSYITCAKYEIITEKPKNTIIMWNGYNMRQPFSAQNNNIKIFHFETTRGPPICHNIFAAKHAYQRLQKRCPLGISDAWLHNIFHVVVAVVVVVAVTNFFSPFCTLLVQHRVVFSPFCLC